MRVLVFCDDQFHSGAAVRAGLAPLVRSGQLDIEWVEDATNWDPSSLHRHSIALLSKSNSVSHRDHRPWLVGDTENLFRDFVATGNGLVAVHSGTASYKDVAPVRAVLGGVFVHHPPPGDVLLIPRAGHPVADGVPPFTIHDEHYHMALDAADADVFLHSRSAAGEQPAGWTRTANGGRVCVLTPGHFSDVWLHASFQRLLVNALRWVAPSR